MLSLIEERFPRDPNEKLAIPITVTTPHSRHFTNTLLFPTIAMELFLIVVLEIAFVIAWNSSGNASIARGTPSTGCNEK